jgi:hypothetical protein
MNYPSIRIEGAILSPDLLDRLEELTGQRPADFGLESGTKVKDEIARAWADAQDYWRIFQRKLGGLRPGATATTETRQQWVVPLLGLLGYQLEYQPRGVEIGGKNYPISHRIANRGDTPIHIIGAGEAAGLDRKPERAVRRMSAHGMVQEYLNLQDELYGLVTNGRVLRLLRDSSRLVKLTYLEFDLERIFSDGLFADFAILYRLLHASRLPLAAQDGAESLIERYHQDSLDSGARIRDGLSRAVEQALRDFANGFLTNSANADLQAAAATGKLTPTAYYQLLLRLIYRLLFLLVIEERDLIFPATAEARGRQIYERYYSLQRLRRLSEKRYLADGRRHDLWLSLLATFRLFEEDGPGVKLGVAPLAGDLFEREAIGLLNRCTLGNDVLLGCLNALGLYQHPDTGQRIRVNYAALNVEEFGSVYEGLLEYEARFLTTEQGGASRRVTFAFVQGDDRAATGSHYTADDLVQPLLKHSLDYLIADKLATPTPEAALLSLRVGDIACGSGHILLAAARRIGTALATARTGEEQPSPGAFRQAVRDVIRTCIYGVDLNPLAVELCKVALWLEAHVPGEPLNFLDHHIKCGNAIVGFARPEELAQGVPDEAFAAQLVNNTGGHKATGTALRQRNKAERSQQGQLSLQPPAQTQAQMDRLLGKWRALTALPETTPAQIRAKKAQFEAFEESDEAWLLGQIAAIPIAQFYLPKSAEYRDLHITDGEFREYWRGVRRPQGQATAEAWGVARQKRFFHWFLEFPEIMAKGGFDCILGNPPYLGGQALSGTYGYPFCDFVKWEYAPTGLSELVVFFARRIFGLLRPGGLTAFITTNSITDGDVRKDGLEQVLAQGGSINFAMRGIKWPGRANLVVSLVALNKGKWCGPFVLDGKEVPVISAYFEDSVDLGDPLHLHHNSEQLSQGSIFLGDGFLLTHDQADGLLQEDHRNNKVIFKVMNGEEINNRPKQDPNRSIIFFHDWTENVSRQFIEPFAVVEREVRPYRENKNQKDMRAKRLWWLFKRPTINVYERIQDLPRCFVAAATTKYLNFSAVPTNYIFLNTLYVFTTDRWDLYAVVQSTLHDVWARKYSGALGATLRYSPSDCFDTFPFPGDLWQTPVPGLAALGEAYHEHRRGLMGQLWLGLTPLYNLFHAPDLTPALVAKVSKQADAVAEAGYAGLLALRRLHVKLDTAIRDAYGWSDLDLGHDFHDVETLPENDRVRYTLSPAARKEVLRRLLALNHARAGEEAEKEKVKGKRGGGEKAAEAQMGFL